MTTTTHDDCADDPCTECRERADAAAEMRDDWRRDEEAIDDMERGP